MTKRMVRLALALAVIASLSSLIRAQEPPKQDPVTKPRPPRPVQRVPAEEPSKTEPDRVEPALEQMLPKIMAGLAEQVDKLTTEVRLLRRETQRNATAMELLLYEERLSKVEAKLDDLTALKNQLDAREQEVQRRSRNIQQELILRAGPILRRDEAEAAIKAELLRALEDTRAQKETTQQRISELQNQAEALRRRIEMLRKKLEQLETRSDTEPK